MDRPYVNIHTHRSGGEGIEMIYTVGVHPWQVDEYANSADDGSLAVELRNVENRPARAIGEIGLDFAPAVSADHGLQKMVFAAQLRIAVDRGLPVILHCVKAFEPAMEILAAYRLRAVIFHGFVGSPQQARRAVNSGYHLSLGERSLTSPKTMEAMRYIPLEAMFLETDDSAVPIGDIYVRASNILAIPVARLKEQLYTNYINIFEQ